MKKKLSPQLKNQKKSTVSEIKIYGYHACLKVFESRPQDIIRLYCDESRVKPLSPLLKWCASHKKAYHIVSPEELEKITQSVHHEGVCLLIVRPPSPTFAQLLQALKNGEDNICLVYLDDVQNPHNLGSILRTCAHFGVRYVLGDQTKLPELSASSYRIARGGAEMVQMIPLDNPKAALQALKKLGFTLIGTSSHAKHSLYRYSFPERTLLAIGGEGEGLSPFLLKEVSTVLQIPGAGQVESLNVSVASALCLGEYWRQRHSPPS